MSKTNSSYRYVMYHVGYPTWWGNYCPETGEYYLARVASYGPEFGEVVEVLASARLVREDEWQEQSERGYDYEVVRELLQLGHLTPKTLASFVAADGEVWWDQPNFFHKEEEEK